MSLNHKPLPVLEPELALAAACCAWPVGGRSRDRVRAGAARVERWDRFEHLVDVHRIVPLAHSALADSGARVPEELLGRLRDRARQAASFDLRLAAESIRLQRAFDDAEIPMVVLKGVAIGMLGYGRLGMKMSWDIDLLVDRWMADRARRLLASLGYRAMFDEAQCAAIGEHAHELTFRHANGIELDVHTRLCANPRMFAGVDARGTRQTVELPGGTIAALADEALFAYLCFHGATHHWSRLKWLADLNAFAVARRDKLGALLDAANAYGVSRSASNALHLANELFGTEWPNMAAGRLEDGWISRALRTDAVTAPAFRGRSAGRPWRSWMLQFGLEKGSGHFASHLKSRWYSTIDRATLRLPRGLGFAYHLVRIPLFVWRTARRRLFAAN